LVISGWALGVCGAVVAAPQLKPVFLFDLCGQLLAVCNQQNDLKELLRFGFKPKG
jgi:hypothetical protein